MADLKPGDLIYHEIENTLVVVVKEGLTSGAGRVVWLSSPYQPSFIGYASIARGAALQSYREAVDKGSAHVVGNSNDLIKALEEREREEK